MSALSVATLVAFPSLGLVALALVLLGRRFTRSALAIGLVGLLLLTAATTWLVRAVPTQSTATDELSAQLSVLERKLADSEKARLRSDQELRLEQERAKPQKMPGDEEGQRQIEGLQRRLGQAQEASDVLKAEAERRRIERESEASRRAQVERELQGARQRIIDLEQQNAALAEKKQEAPRPSVGVAPSGASDPGASAPVVSAPFASGRATSAPANSGVAKTAPSNSRQTDLPSASASPAPRGSSPVASAGSSAAAATSATAGIADVRARLDKGAASSFYQVLPLGRRELVTGRRGHYYVLRPKIGEKPLRFPARQFRLASAGALQSSLRHLAEDIIAPLQRAGVTARLFARGSADSSRIAGPVETPDVASLAVLRRIPGGAYAAVPSQVHIDGAIRNEQLPVLRADWLRRQAGRAMPGDVAADMAILSDPPGRGYERRAELVLYVEWGQ